MNKKELVIEFNEKKYNLVKIIHSDGGETNFEYDNKGDIINFNNKEVLENVYSNNAVYEYDAKRDAMNKKFPNGDVYKYELIQHSYLPLKSEIKEDIMNFKNLGIEFNEKEYNLVKLTEHKGGDKYTVEYIHNDKNQCIKEIYTDTNNHVEIIENEYDENDDKIKKTCYRHNEDPNTKTITNYTYDDMHRVTSEFTITNYGTVNSYFYTYIGEVTIRYTLPIADIADCDFTVTELDGYICRIIEHENSPCRCETVYGDGKIQLKKPTDNIVVNYYRDSNGILFDCTLSEYDCIKMKYFIERIKTFYKYDDNGNCIEGVTRHLQGDKPDVKTVYEYELKK